MSLVGAVGGSAALAADSQSQIPTSGEKVAGAPFEVKRDWGTFKLADRIAAEVKAGEEINYVFSYQASGIPLFSPQFAAGFATGWPAGRSIRWIARSGASTKSVRSTLLAGTFRRVSRNRTASRSF